MYISKARAPYFGLKYLWHRTDILLKIAPTVPRCAQLFRMVMRFGVCMPNMFEARRFSTINVQVSLRLDELTVRAILRLEIKYWVLGMRIL